MTGRFLLAAILLLGIGGAYGSARAHDEDEARRIFGPGSLEIICITGPDLGDWSALGARNVNPDFDEPYRTIRDFVVETIFTRREEILYSERHGLYANVRYDMNACEVTCDVHTHTPYTVKVDGAYIELLQEMWRQKNIAFMVDLWRMALGGSWVSSCHGPWTLRRLMCLLGSVDAEAECDVPEADFLTCLRAVTLAHKEAHATPHDKVKKEALARAAGQLILWSKTYEASHVGAAASPHNRFLLTKSATFPVEGKRHIWE